MRHDSTIRRRHVWFSREGISFLFVLTFIVVGAVIRQVNLLFVLAGLLIAALLINWRYAMASIRKLSVRRHAPQLLHAGQTLVVDFDIENRSQTMASCNVNIRDRIQRLNVSGSERNSAETRTIGRKRRRPVKINVNFPEIPAGQVSNGHYRCLLTERGKYRLGPLVVSTRFPLGLVWAFGLLRQNHTIEVAPRLGRLVGKWAELVHGRARSGEHRSQRYSSEASGDFYSIRPWRSGDSRRSIHWRSSAKTGQLEVRQFEEQRDGGVALILDFWRPAAATETQAAFAELAASVMATAVDQTLRELNGPFYAAIAGESTKHFDGISSLEMRKEIFRYLAIAQPDESPDTGECLERCKQEGRIKQQLIVISTRPECLPQLIDKPDWPVSLQVCWMDVSSPEIESLFRLDGI